MTPRRAVALAALALACTVGQKKAATSKALDDAGRRREVFEATLRVLDEKPEYVDEFFALALDHRKTVHRFIADTAGKLDTPWLARVTGTELALHPKALTKTVEATTDAVLEHPASQSAYLQAMVSRKEGIAKLLAANPDAALAILRASMKEGTAGAALAEGVRDLLR